MQDALQEMDVGSMIGIFC